MSTTDMMDADVTDNVTLGLNVSGDVTPADDEHHLPVFGLPGQRFVILHATALVSLAISIAFSGSVSLYLLKDCTPVWRRTIGERLTIYLAFCDLFYSISHMLDHAYMMGAYDHPPDTVCVAFAFFVAEFILVQSLLVSFTAINAFLLVVNEIKVSLGRYDWRLIVGAVGIPAAALIPMGVLGMIGPSGGWCLIDMRKATGPIVTTVISCVLLVTFLANLVCYLLVWAKIRQVSRNTASLGQSSQQARYHGTARILMLFVAAYIFQWWSYVTYSVWSLFGYPHFITLVVTVLLCNMGGLFNFVAYTFVRALMRARPKRGEADAGGAPVTSSGSTSLTGSKQTIATELESNATK